MAIKPLRTLSARELPPTEGFHALLINLERLPPRIRRSDDDEDAIDAAIGQQSVD